MVFSFKSANIMYLLAVLLSVGMPVHGNWNQIGTNINGEASGDLFGSSVAMSANGTAIVVGAPSNNGGTASFAGHVRVYNFNASVKRFAQIGSDIDGEGDSDSFGYSVAMSADGTTFVVGAPFNDGVVNDSGHARVYKLNSSRNGYTQFGSDIDGTAEFDQFGFSVAMSADGATIVIGSPTNAGVNGKNSGCARVYKINASSNSYTQFGSDIVGEAMEDQFGYSVDMSADGTMLVVGAPYNDGIGSDSGHARVYQLNFSTNGYTQIGSDIEGEDENNNFGYSVAMSASGTTIVVGAPYNNGINGTSSGHARVYKLNASGNIYEQIGSDIDGEATDDEFGYSVAMSADGSSIVVGAVVNGGNGMNSGHARVYKINSSGNRHTQFGSDINGAAEEDRFGYSVTMSADGAKVAVGAPYNNDIGHVRVFESITTTPTTAAPTKIPTRAPVKVPIKSPVRVPSKAPLTVSSTTAAPVKSPTTKCCFFRRLFRLGGC